MKVNESSGDTRIGQSHSEFWELRELLNEILKIEENPLWFFSSGFNMAAENLLKACRPSLKWNCVKSWDGMPTLFGNPIKGKSLEKLKFQFFNQKYVVSVTSLSIQNIDIRYSMR